MNTSKRIFVVSMLVLSTFSIISYSSCKGKCGDITCQNGGTCEEGFCECITGFEGEFCETQRNVCDNGGELKNGMCECDPGYEGQFCETFARVKFLGEWTADGGYYTFIAPGGAAPPQVKISNMAHTFFNNEVLAYVNGNTITIDNQSPDNNNRSIEGSGIYDKSTNKITWHYTLYEAPGLIYERDEIWSPG